MDIVLRWHMSLDVLVHRSVGLAVGELGFSVVLVEGLGALRDKVLLHLLWLTATILAAEWAEHDLDNVDVKIVVDLDNLGDSGTTVSNGSSEGLACALKLEDLDVLNLVSVLPDLFNLEFGHVEWLLLDGEDIANDGLGNTSGLAEDVG